MGSEPASIDEQLPDGESHVRTERTDDGTYILTDRRLLAKADDGTERAIELTAGTSVQVEIDPAESTKVGPLITGLGFILVAIALLEYRSTLTAERATTLALVGAGMGVVFGLILLLLAIRTDRGETSITVVPGDGTPPQTLTFVGDRSDVVDAIRSVIDAQPTDREPSTGDTDEGPVGISWT